MVWIQGVVLVITFYKGAGYAGMESGTDWLYSLFAGHGTRKPALHGAPAVVMFVWLLRFGSKKIFD